LAVCEELPSNICFLRILSSASPRTGLLIRLCEALRCSKDEVCTKIKKLKKEIVININGFF
jgi:hypothetical protein